MAKNWVLVPYRLANGLADGAGPCPAPAHHYKGRSRDTAWFSIIDSEWHRIKAALETWLSDENFSTDGIQRMSLVDIRRRLVD